MSQTQQQFLPPNQQPVFTQEQFQSLVSNLMSSLNTQILSSQEKAQEKDEKIQATQPPVLLENQQPVFTQEQFRSLLSTVMSSVNKQVPSTQEKSRENEDKFRAADLGFFDPDNEATQPIDYVDGKTIYHNVFSFIHRIKVNTTGVTSGCWANSNVAAKLHLCLRGKAEKWYTNEISAVTRAGLKAGVELWCQELEARFRESPSIALQRLERLR
ncbi:hypothetical protein K3495_g16784, partial [Podosphaera aphanis]